MAFLLTHELLAAGGGRLTRNPGIGRSNVDNWAFHHLSSQGMNCGLINK
jgi:hypothetical protein